MERAGKPQPSKFVSISGKLIDTTPPEGMEFWARLADVIENNPVQEHDRFYMAMLQPLGIEKGKPFQPDARQTAILEEAAALGDAMSRNVMYEVTQRTKPAKPFPGTQWDWVILVSPRRRPRTTASSTSGCSTPTAPSTCPRASG